MIPGKTNEEEEEVDRKGEMPIQAALMSELLLWEPGAQSLMRAPLGSHLRKLQTYPTEG